MAPTDYVPGHNDFINVHELRHIVRGLKNKKAVGNDGIPSEVYKFTSERLLTMMSIFLSGCMLSGKIPSTLMHVVIILLLKWESKDPADVNNYRPIAIATALSKVLEQVLVSRFARYQVLGGPTRKHTRQKLPYLHSSKPWIFTVIRTHLYTCAFLMQKRHLM